MTRQVCNVCGNEIINDRNGTLTFCTNCGASLINQFYTPNAQIPQVYPTRKPKQPLSGKEKLAFGALIAIPVMIVMGILGVIGFIFYAVANNMPPPGSNPRSYPTPKPLSSKSKNALLTFGTDGLGQGQFKRASAITVGKDGSIYVGDGTLRIQKFDAAGKFVKLWNITESSAKTNDQYSNGVTNLAVDSKNTVYAVVEKNELLRYDGNTGKFIGKVELNGEKWMNKTQEAKVLDMFMQNDDNLAVLATSFPDGEYVMSVSPDGKGTIKHKNLLRGQIKNPTTMMGGGILVSVTGDIFLLNSYVSTEKSFIYRYKSDGSYVDRFTWEGAPSSSIFSNSVIALNSKGELYAYNAGKKQINVLNVEGVLQRSIPLDADYIEKFLVDANDNIFIVKRDKIEKYPPAGS